LNPAVLAELLSTLGVPFTFELTTQLSSQLLTALRSSFQQGSLSGGELEGGTLSDDEGGGGSGGGRGAAIRAGGGGVGRLTSAQAV